MSVHSIFSPSSMNKIVNCYGHVHMVKNIQEEKTEEAKEGDAAHWLAAQLIRDRMNMKPNDIGLGRHTYLGEAAFNNVIITEDMVEAAMEFYNQVMSVAGHGHIQKLHVEELLYMPQIHELCFGTPDVWLYIEEKKVIHVWDFKFGFSEVDAFENWQMIAYDLGILNLISQQPLAQEGFTFVNHIVQPRCYHKSDNCSDWHALKDFELRNYVNIMHHACAASLMPEAKVTSGNHCIGCKARSVCPALANSVQSIIEYSRTAIHSNLSNNALAVELNLINDAEKLLKYRKEALEQSALSKLHNGQSIPGWKLKQGYTNNHWVTSDDKVIQFGKLLGVDLDKGKVAITPHQAKIKVKQAEMDESVLNGLFKREPTCMKLVNDDGSKARNIFSNDRSYET